MGDQGFRYTVHPEDKAHLIVHRKTLNALKTFAKQNDMTLVAATFVVIQTGLAYLMDRDRIKKQAVFKKFVRLGRIAWQRQMDRTLERRTRVEEP